MNQGGHGNGGRCRRAIAGALRRSSRGAPRRERVRPTPEIRSNPASEASSHPYCKSSHRLNSLRRGGLKPRAESLDQRCAGYFRSRRPSRKGPPTSKGLVLTVGATSEIGLPKGSVLTPPRTLMVLKVSRFTQFTPKTEGLACPSSSTSQRERPGRSKNVTFLRLINEPRCEPSGPAMQIRIGASANPVVALIGGAGALPRRPARQGPTGIVTQTRQWKAS